MDRVVFDFDGVIVRNRRMGEFITREAERFVEKKMSCYPSKSKEMNRVLYTTYGHTALGVAKALCEDPRQVTREFNQFVYGDLKYRRLRNLVRYHDITRLLELKNTFAPCNEKAALLTNAPLAWCENVCSIIGVDLYTIIDSEKCVTSDNLFLKPDCHNYQLIESLYDTEQLLKEKETLMFMDDSHVNFTPVLQNPLWSCVHIDSDSIELLGSHLRASNIS